ncbi:hypothetical protein AMECASPLE_023213 [Ameca splendens]|uniref:Uncharacterized protein n=1 Tax=Ameca splendens TaxID=208324 RepID=A0ABV1A0S3_9TELE
MGGGGVHPGQVASPSQGNIQDKQQCTHPFTPKGKLKRPINLIVMFLDCGRKPEYLERTHACTGRTCKLHVERLSATNCAIVQPASCPHLKNYYSSNAPVCAWALLYNHTT